MTARNGSGITRLRRESRPRRGPDAARQTGTERARAVEVGEFLELVFVFITIFVGLGIMTLFGKWWER